MILLCFILFDIITNGTSSSSKSSDINDQDISLSSSSSTTAVGDAYTLLNKIKTSCEMNSMVVGSKLVDYYNSYDEHTDRYIRMTNDYFTRQLGFAYWLQSSYMYNHLLSSSSPSSMQHPHHNVKDRFHEITAIQKQNGWNYEYMTLLVTSDHEGHHRHYDGVESSSNDGDIVIAPSLTSSTYETSTSQSIPATDTSTTTVTTTTTTTTTTGTLEKTVGYQYNSLLDKWIYFLGDSTLHQLFHTFLRVDHGMGCNMMSCHIM
jgi:hypothetical protein